MFVERSDFARGQNQNNRRHLLVRVARLNNGSLFTYLTATVTVNGLENEMSSELRFQGRKWGGRKQGNP